MTISSITATQTLIVGLLSAGSLCAQDYPHAFPRQGATKLFENERVMVWEASWPNGVPQQIHQHKYDMAGVFLRYGQIKVTSLDGKFTLSQPFDVPRPIFQAKGVTHKEEAVGGPGDPERLAIMVDLKEYTPPAFETKSGLNSAFPREGAKDVIDNARVRIWEYSWQLKKPVALHIHDKDCIEVWVQGGTLLTKSADGKEETKTFSFKDARFVPRDRVDSEEAVSGSPRAFIIELK